MNQNTVNLIVIVGVLVMGAGAFAVPWYQGQMQVGLLDVIDSNISSAASDASAAVQNQQGTGVSGTSLIALAGQIVDQSKLKNIMGDSFTNFNTAFLTLDSEAQQFSNLEIRSFSPALETFKLPNDVDNGFAVNELNGAPGSANHVCGDPDNAGTLFTVDPDDTDGNVTTIADLGVPLGVTGFAIKAPDYTGGNPHIVEVTLCIDDFEAFADEIVKLIPNEIYTKNFNFGHLFPGDEIRIMIDDLETVADFNESNQNYEVWIFFTDPTTVDPIQHIDDKGGVLAGFGTCTSIKIDVEDSSGNGDTTDGAFVQIFHSFLPFETAGVATGGNNAGTASSITIDASFFGGPMPGGEYFIEVFPVDTGDVPAFSQIDCPDLGDDNAVGGAGANEDDATIETTVIVDTAANVLAGGNTGNLFIFIHNEFDVDITQTRIIVTPFFSAFDNVMCEDGVAGTPANTICQDISGLDDSTLAVGTLVDDAADGELQINNLPMDPTSPGGNTGDYFIDILTKEGIQCGGPVSLFSGGTSTAEIFCFGAA